jgi:hypothetical protein
MNPKLKNQSSEIFEKISRKEDSPLKLLASINLIEIYQEKNE